MDICQCDDVELGNKRAERRGEQKAILGDGVRTQFVAGRWLTPSSAAGGGGFGGCGGLGGIREHKEPWWGLYGRAQTPQDKC